LLLPSLNRNIVAALSESKLRRTGKIKANRKKLRQKGFKFRDEDEKNGNEDELMVTPSEKTETPTNALESENNDSQVMSYFTLPAEYAFVARAISQMDGVGKSLDPDFDFVSNAAPYIVEIKGTDLYLKDEATKILRSCQDRICMFLKWFESKLGESRAE
jgi:hypothetical protein